MPIRIPVVIALVIAVAIGVSSVAPAQEAGGGSGPQGRRCSSGVGECAASGLGSVQLFGDSRCNWTAQVHWGDGQTDTVHYTSSASRTHQYTRQGFWKVSFTGSGSPNQANVTCNFNPSSFVLEYPFTEAQRAIFIRAKALAGKTRKPAKKLKSIGNKLKNSHGAKKKELIKKGSTQEKILQKVADKGKEVTKDWVQEQIAKNIKATLGIGQETVKKLWGFGEALVKLDNFPKAAVKAADKLYPKDSDFKGKLDALSRFYNSCNESYAKCNAADKQAIATDFYVEVQDGSVKQFINDAADAGIAASKVSLSLPGE